MSTNQNAINSIATISAAALLSIVPPGAVLAQGATAGANAGGVLLEEITVTARKTSERLQDVPVSVSVIEGDFIENRGILNIQEAAKFVPGFSFRTDHSQRAFTGFRGIGVQGGGSQPSIGVFVDGVYQPGVQFFSQPLLDVERIEFLKGPQGTLYGRNTLGGAISIITRRPTNDWNGRIELGAGNAATRSAQGTLNMPLVEDHAFLRVSASHDETEGFQRSTVRNNMATFRDVDSVRASLLLQPSERFEATLSTYYTDQFNSANTYAIVQRPDQFSRLFQGNDRPLTDFYRYGAALQARYSVSPNFDISSISSYDRLVTNAAVFDTDYSPLPTSRFESEPNPKSVTQEFRFAWDGDGSVDALAGLFWSRETPLTNARSFSNGVQLSRTRSEVEIESLAAFGNLTFRPTERWELVAGLRYDDVKLEQVQRRLDLPASATNPFVTRGTEGEFQPKLSATYFWNPDFMTYASAARGYRGGGFNSALAPLNRRTFDPERTVNYELGTKSSFWDKRGLVSLAVYFITQEDAQVNEIVLSITPPAVTNVTSNAGEVESKGVEIDAALLPVDGLRINAAFSYNDAEIVASPDPLLVGTRPNSIERMRAVLGVNYERDLSATLQGFGGVTYTGAGPITFNNGVDKQPYYELVDLQAGLRISERYEVMAYVNNIFDEEYQTIYSFVGLLQAGGRLSLIGDPRTYGLRVRAKW